MADVIGMSDVSSPDTGKGSQLKTGGKRSHNMASKCKVGQVWDQKLKKCKPAPNRQKSARLKAETKQLYISKGKNLRVIQINSYFEPKFDKIDDTKNKEAF